MKLFKKNYKNPKYETRSASRWRKVIDWLFSYDSVIHSTDSETNLWLTRFIYDYFNCFGGFFSERSKSSVVALFGTVFPG